MQYLIIPTFSFLNNPQIITSTPILFFSLKSFQKVYEKKNLPIERRQQGRTLLEWQGSDKLVMGEESERRDCKFDLRE